MIGKRARLLSRLLILHALGYLVAAAISKLWFTYHISPKLASSEKSLEAYYPEILADLEQSDQNPIFADAERKVNAEPFLSQHIAWFGSSIPAPPSSYWLRDLKTASDIPKPSSPDFQIRTKILSAHRGSNISKKYLDDLMADPDFKTCPLAWVDELASYDHWNLTTHPSYRKLLTSVSRASGLGRISRRYDEWRLAPGI